VETIMSNEDGRFAADLFNPIVIVAITASGIVAAAAVLDLPLADVIALAMSSTA
jgi:hypothetical protein